MVRPIPSLLLALVGGEGDCHDASGGRTARGASYDEGFGGHDWIYFIGCRVRISTV